MKSKRLVFEKLGFYNYWQITFIFLFFILMILNFLLLTIKEASKNLSMKNELNVLKNSKISIFGEQINLILLLTLKR